jgi:hypothetical protein
MHLLLGASTGVQKKKKDLELPAGLSLFSRYAASLVL